MQESILTLNQVFENNCTYITIKAELVEEPSTNYDSCEQRCQ